MSLQYNIVSQSTGDENTSSQVLSQNTIGYDKTTTIGSYFSYDYPVYRINGATLDYYGKDYNSISYDISNGKLYSLFFTGNTHSISGTTLLSFDLYRLTYEDYLNYSLFTTASTVNIESIFTNPLLSVDLHCSAITLTSSAFTYNFPTQYKDVGSFTKNTFGDKNQYILDTVFSFEQPNDMTLGDAYFLDTTLLSNNTNINVPTRLFLDPSATTFVNSNLGPFIITGDTPFSGITINGAFFTYLVPPKVPQLNVSGGRSQIAIQGTITNLSPIFNFSNVDDGDYYQLQVNYDTTDSSYSGSEIYTHVINKQAGDAEFVRTFSTPLRANDSFIYRIGNTKEIVNIFNNKQSITKWSDSIETTIQSTGLFSLSGYTWKNYISNTYDGSYTVSGMTITGGAYDALTFDFITTATTMPNNTISATTDGISRVIVSYSGSVTTLDWQNAILSASSWSSLGLTLSGGSSGTGITDSVFSFTTSWKGMPDVNLTLLNIFNNTLLDLSIDTKSSLSTVVLERTSYVDTVLGQTFNEISDSMGFFDFGQIDGGYYLLTATPSAPTYAAFEPIQRYITIDSNTSLDLIFSIIWGNNIFTFADLQNETFL